MMFPKRLLAGANGSDTIHTTVIDGDVAVRTRLDEAEGVGCNMHEGRIKGDDAGLIEGDVRVDALIAKYAESVAGDSGIDGNSRRWESSPGDIGWAFASISTTAGNDGVEGEA